MELWMNPNDVSVQHPLTEWEPTPRTNPLTLVDIRELGRKGVGGPGNLLANIIDTGNASHILYSTNGLIQTNMFQHVAMTP